MGRKPVKVRSTSDTNTRLDEAYAELPAIECKGKCWDSCGPIMMTEAERTRISDRHGLVIEDMSYQPGRPLVCPALTMLNRCGVYADRPAICRLWGLVESMPCNFGCRPEGGLWSDQQGYLWLARVHDAAGERREAARLREQWSDPALAARSSAFLRDQADEAEVHRQVRQRRAEARGTAYYVAGPGRLTRDRTEQCR